MNRNKFFNRKKILIFTAVIFMICIALGGRLVYLMVFKARYYSDKANEVQKRERSIKAARGKIISNDGMDLASNKTVCTISVIHSQITDPEAIIKNLSELLELNEDEVRTKVEKVSSREKIKSNVDKDIGDKIRELNLDGVKVDEDYKRYYPYSTLASKVLGFTGADNQGILGIEAKYEEYLKGTDGTILTLTDARGIELTESTEERIEPVSGLNLNVSIDVNIQTYAEQIARKALEAKEANYVSIIVMNPNNGEIYACVNAPEYDLNNPYTLNYETEEELSETEMTVALNQMWRNQCINDTYEPGSTFKIFTATSALEEKVVDLDTSFVCPGYKIVEDRRIRCHKTAGHGAETFLEGFENSCNPVFIEVGLKVGVDNFYKYFDKLQILEKTGIDLSGEATTIMHKKENVGQVELATMSFGQSFQITPIRFLTSVCAVINGGTVVTPHFGVSISDNDGNVVKTFEYNTTPNAISKETSDTMKYMLEKVVSEGGGSKAYIEGYRIGGKTATSQKLPRNSGKYIASFIGFAPADNPQVIAMVIIDEPSGIYYGGTIAAPLVEELYENILPYLGIEKTEDTSSSEK